MAFRLKLLGVLLLAALSFCHGKSANVKVVGTISCAECLNHELSSSQSSSGLSVVLHCKTRNAEMRTLGKGSMNREGKFNIILSAENIEDKKSIHRCYTTLHGAIAASCPVRAGQTATMKILVSRDNATQVTQIVHKTVKFSPVTCQSAFFWHFFNFPPLPNFTLPSPDTPDTYAPSPPESITPDVPLQSPSLPPPLPPAFIPPATPASPPQVPELEQPTPSPVPPFPEQSSPPLPPILAPEGPEPHTKSPTPPLNGTPPENQVPPPTPIGILTPPIQNMPNTIPIAPPVPQLPPVPAGARKYFNSPTSK